MRTMARVEDREEVYTAVVQTVTANTNNEKQGLGMRHMRVLSNRKQAGHDLTQVRKALKAAVKNVDLIQYRGEFDKRRYCLPTAENVRRVIEMEIERPGETRRGFVGELNKLLTAMDDQ